MALLATMASAASLRAQGAAPPGPVCIGRVTDTGGAPIAGAQVTLTPAGDSGRTLTARTGDDGRYALSCERLSAGYNSRVTRVGFASQFQPLSVAAGDTVRLDFTLKPVAQQLAAVTTRATRPLPRASTNGSPRTPGANVVSLDLSAEATGDPMGDLASALGMLPELSVTPDGLSAMGAGPDQQLPTLNGMEHAGELPRDGLVPSIYLSTYDPRQGRFSGAQIAYVLPSGTDAPKRLLHVTAQDPPLQWGGAGRANAFSRSPMRNILNGYASGPLVRGRTYYDATFQIQHRRTVVSPLDAATPDLLATLELEPDSVANLLAVARSVGLPVATGRQSQETKSGSFAVRLDFTPSASIRRIDVERPPEDQLYLLASGAWGRSVGGMSPTALASVGATNRHTGMQLMAGYVTSKLRSATADSKLSVSLARDVRGPSAALPGASVFVDSRLGAGSDSIGGIPLRLGGATLGAADVQSLKLQANTDISWYTWTRAHQFDLFAEVQAESYRARQAGRGFGSFSFNSVADLAAASPAAFERTLGDAGVSIPAMRGTLAFGDVFSVGRKSAAANTGLTLQYGLRLDAERYGKMAGNPAIASIFGLRTDRLPDAVSLQPMAGFTWGFTPYTTPVGSVTMIGHRNTLTGGVRQYRGGSSLASLAGVAQQNGLPTGVTTLRCIGAAVPTPLWGDYLDSPESVPSACADGTSPLLAETGPSVAAFASNYAPQSRWTGELKFSHEFGPFWTGTLGGSLTRVSSVADPVDVNFDPTTRFTLASEGERPVFVSEASIVPASGAVSSRESRLSPDYTRVIEWRSDLRATQRQLTAGVNYNFGASLLTADFAGYPRVSGRIGLSYVLAGGTIERRGFASTAGDPRTVSSFSQAAPTHSILLSLSLRRSTWWSLTTTARLSSGFAYTPLVGGDINGDGALNDRAFVFDPRLSTDSVVVAGMQQLLTTASPATRACLAGQLGRIAAPNSCRGGWTASMGAITLGLDPYRIGLGSRGNLSLTLTNVLSAVDLAMHGSRGLRGWGQPAWPESVLLTPRGFDASRRAFQYAVNPLFGTTSGMRRANLSPASLIVDFRLDLGPSRESQAVRTLVGGLDASALRDQAAVKARLMRSAAVVNGGEPDVDKILARSDSIHLTADQTAALRLISHRLQGMRDSTYGALASFISTHADDPDEAAVQREWHTAGVALVRALYDAGQSARALLQPDQLEHLRVRGVAPSLWYTTDWLDRQLRAPIIVLR